MATILVDMDDTIVEFRQVWLDRYNEMYNDNLTLEDIPMWDWGMHTKCGTQGILEILKQPGFFTFLRPKENAIEVLQRLSKRHEILIVTAAVNSDCMTQKAKWYERHLPFLPLSHFNIMTKKHMLMADLLYDDAPHNIERFRGETVALRQYHNYLAEPTWFVHNQEEFEYIVRHHYE